MDLWGEHRGGPPGRARGQTSDTSTGVRARHGERRRGEDRRDSGRPVRRRGEGAAGRAAQGPNTGCALGRRSSEALLVRDSSHLYKPIGAKHLSTI